MNFLLFHYGIQKIFILSSLNVCIEIAMPPNNPLELFSVMQALSPALKSINVRTIAITPESTDEWQNLITSIFLTEKSVDQVRKQQQNMPTFRNKKNDFAFFQNAYSFDNSSFFEELVKGEVRFPDSFGINKVYFRKFDPLSLIVHSTEKRDVDSAKWKSEFKGKTYYFCAPGCKVSFDKDPKKYLK